MKKKEVPLKTQIDNAVLLKIPNEVKPEPIGTNLSDKVDLLWQKTWEAGQRENALPVSQRIKHILWDYNLGTMKGWIKGIGGVVTGVFNPRSNFYRADYLGILRDIQDLPDTALNHGITFMEKDWAGRGELNAEKSIQGGMWVLKLYLGSKILGQGFVKGAKKLLLPSAK